MVSSHELLFLIVRMGCVVLQSVGAMDHIVGGSFGWSIPKNITYYQDWAKGRSFSVGDNLVFLFTTGVHNVLEVSQEDLAACTQDNVNDVHYSGPATVPLATPGDHYYYCGVGTHCQDGQKLSINTVSSSTDTPRAPGPDGTDTVFADNESPANSVLFSGGLAGLLSLLLSLFM